MTTSPDARPLSDEAVEAAARHMAKDHAQTHGYSLEATLNHVEMRWKRYAPEAREILTAALAHTRPAAEPVAKPMEWEHLGGDFYRAPAPLFGSIRIEGSNGANFAVYWSIPGFCDKLIEGSFPTVEAAKAAAQARIRSALVASPAPAVTEAVAWRRRGKFKWFYRDSQPPDDDASWQPLAPASPADDRLREVVEALEKLRADTAAVAHHIDEHSFSRALGLLAQMRAGIDAALVSLREREG